MRPMTKYQKWLLFHLGITIPLMSIPGWYPSLVGIPWVVICGFWIFLPILSMIVWGPNWLDDKP